MKALTKLAPVTAAAGLGAAAIAGCGNEVPPNAVAKVGDTIVKKSEFDKWLRTAALGQGQLGGQAVVPDPPDFRRCAAAQQAQPLPKGGKRPTTVESQQRCKDQYNRLKSEVMQFLIQAQWVQQEAAARHVNVSDAEVRRSFDDQKKEAFRGANGEKRYQEFLKSSGRSERDILFQIKLQTLQQKLTQKVTENEGKVSEADIRQYYDKNKKRFAQPERRDLRVVLTKTKAKAEQARSQLTAGKSFKAVAKRFSIDDASKARGGRLPGVAKGQQERALDKAVFGAKKGKLFGPVKTQFGWYVFEVTKVRPASQQSFARSRETIRNLLRSQRQQKALDDFIKSFRSDYRDKTTCANDFRIAECKNGPKERTQTGPTPQAGPTPSAPRGAPQGAPGGAPQGTPPGPSPQGPSGP